MEDISKTESMLWDMANKLRGSMDASEYKNYILGFMFYRFLSHKQEEYLFNEGLAEVDSINEVNDWYIENASTPEDFMDYAEDLTTNLGYAIKPEYTWQSMMKKIEEGTLKPSYYQAMFDSFNQSTILNKDAEKDFKNIFNDMNLGDSRLGSTTVERAHALAQIVDLINSINLNDDSGKDVLGQIYEYLIGQFAANAGKKSGEFFTPFEISKILARIVTYGWKSSKTPFTVYDPTCGSGSLLLTVGHTLEGGDRTGAVKYYGQEKNTTTYNLARMNLMMHNVAYKDMCLNNGDTLGQDWPDGIDAFGIDQPRSFDAVVANPPYSAHWDATEDRMKDERFKNYGKLAPKTKADYAFLLHGLYHLNDVGTMAIILPHGILFRGNAEGVIRKALIEKNSIDTIIGLPANLFYGTSIPTIIMVLKKNRKSKDILFIDASQYFTKSKNKNTLSQEDIDRILNAYQERTDIEKYSHVASYDEVVKNDFNLNIPRYVDTSEAEEEIDLQTVLKDIQKDNEEIAELSKKVNEQLMILGVIDHPIDL